MMPAPNFAEITELGSRAVWYSDEESDADESEVCDLESKPITRLGHPVGIKCHDDVRAKLSLHFKRLKPSPNALTTSCIISLSSSAQYKTLKINYPNQILIGTFGNSGKVIVCPSVLKSFNDSSPSECSLWLLFDSSDPILNGQEVAYFVELLREQLYSELGLQPNSPIIVLSRQFSNTEHLEYLTNFQNPSIPLPFLGRPMLPPAIIKNQMESALFEQSTLALKFAYVVCLPNPKNYWFDVASCWPAIAPHIIENMLNDDNLEKTLIFT